jgi:hypothetical protein
MSATTDIKSKMVDDIRSKLRDFDLRKIALDNAFKSMNIFLSKETPNEKTAKVLYQYDRINQKEVEAPIDIITNEIGNVYELVGELQRNAKLYNTDLIIQENPTLSEKVRGALKGKSPQSKFTSIQNPQTLGISLMEQALAMPKIWNTYLWDMRQRFMLEAEYWKDTEIQRDCIILERNHLEGIVKPAVKTLFMATKAAAQDKIFRMETGILTREVTDDLKNVMFQQPAIQSANKPPPT